MVSSSRVTKIEINGIELHHLEAGRGDPVVLVHGGGATDYRTWLPVIDRFSDGYHVVVPSRRYHFPNEWRGDGSDYSINTNARDIAALMRALGLTPAHIVGSSQGANIALLLACDNPDLVRSLVLAEPAFPDWLRESATTKDLETAAHSRDQIQQAAEIGNYETAARLFADLVIGPGAFDRMPEPVRQRMVDNARVLSLPQVFLDSSHSPFSREDARAITAPTLLLRGDSSPQQFLLANDELAKSMPGAERALIPHAAHLLHAMNPQVFCDVVLAFLARH